MERAKPDCVFLASGSQSNSSASQRRRNLIPNRPGWWPHHAVQRHESVQALGWWIPRTRSLCDCVGPQKRFWVAHDADGAYLSSILFSVMCHNGILVPLMNHVRSVPTCAAPCSGVLKIIIRRVRKQNPRDIFFCHVQRYPPFWAPFFGIARQTVRDTQFWILSPLDIVDFTRAS